MNRGGLQILPEPARPFHDSLIKITTESATNRTAAPAVLSCEEGALPLA